MRQKKKSDPNTYTKPELRDHIKEKVAAGDKGGTAGQWSARKAQLVTQEYQQQGGDYKKPRNEAQKSLKQWGEEHSAAPDHKQTKRRPKSAASTPKKASKKTAAKPKAKK
jgi:hypothetical protein